MRSSSRKPWLVFLMALAVSGCAGVSPARPERSTASVRRPNVVLVVADDLGWGDLSSYGGPVATPNLDMLARDGVRFTEARASAYQCSPSRAGLLTGRYQQRFGHESNFRGPGDGVDGVGLARGMAAFEAGTLEPAGLGLPVDQPILAERLKQLGYRTAMIGKWHLGFDPGMRPSERGFDWFYGFLAGSSPYALAATPDIVTAGHVGAEGRESGDDEGLGSARPAKRSLYYTVRDGLEPVADQSEYLTDLFGRKAVEYVTQQAGDRPFFLYLAHLAPHQPLTVTRKYYDRLPQIADEKRRIYYAMILALDDSIGQLRAALKSKGLEKDTLILFASDNGCPRPRAFCSNGPLREGKQTMYEGGFKIPLVAAWPGRIRPGRVNSENVSLLDIAPTVLAYAGGDPARLAVDGRNLAPLLEHGTTLPGQPIYWRHQIHLAALEGQWKLIVYRDVNGSQAEFLFDLSADPGEKVNLAQKRPDVVARLQKGLGAWETGLAAPRWVPPNPKRRTFDGVTVDLY